MNNSKGNRTSKYNSVESRVERMQHKNGEGAAAYLLLSLEETLRRNDEEWWWYSVGFVVTRTGDSARTSASRCCWEDCGVGEEEVAGGLNR